MGIYKKENLSTMATVEEIGKDAQSGSDKEEEMPELENQEGPKLNRGEKKCRKALMKLGMKQFAGITRVTMRLRLRNSLSIRQPMLLALLIKMNPDMAMATNPLRLKRNQRRERRVRRRKRMKVTLPMRRASPEDTLIW